MVKLNHQCTRRSGATTEPSPSGCVAPHSRHCTHASQMKPLEPTGAEDDADVEEDDDDPEDDEEEEDANENKSSESGGSRQAACTRVSHTSQHSSRDDDDKADDDFPVGRATVEVRTPVF